HRMPRVSLTNSWFVPRAGDPSARIQYVTPARGTNQLFVNDTRGILWATNTAGAAPTAYLDMRTANVGFTEPGSEAGLIGVAFHPNFAGEVTQAGYGTFYTNYTAARGSGTPTYLGNDNASHDNVVREWVVSNPGAATPNIVSSREVIRIGEFAANHNGGTIGFNPTAAIGSADYGKLYIGLGDGGGANDPRDNGQDLTNPLGKILRIDPLAGGAYGIPDDNPFTGQSGTLGEIWALGLRNPQQFSWDSSGRMFIADIGQAQLEEVNLGVAGANYGWPVREGTFAKMPDKGDTNVYTLPIDDATFGFTYPVAQYDHDEGDAISSGFLYEGSLVPELRGMYLLTDNTTGRMFYFDPNAALAGGTAPLSELRLTLGGDPYTFLTGEGYGGRVDLRLGIDAAGELYMLTKKDGDIFRFVTTVPEPGTWAMLTLGFGALGAQLRRRTIRTLA
ncbi:MAG: PEP-CTERM sorting domain-containing protein, partial [Sphingomonadales bacterium]